MKKKIAYIIFIVILLLLFIWTNKLQTLWLFGMFGIIWLPMFFINRYNAGKIAVKFDIINELKEDPALLLEIENSSFFPVPKIRIEFNCENVVFGTSSDDNVDDYNYDYTYHNDTPLESVSLEMLKYFNTILDSEKLKEFPHR